MDDATYVFKKDVQERKSMVSGARHKKNGSKSKSCKLPYENLSYYQRKKLNGEVKSYPMNRPMTWKEFKEYPEDLQETYLATLVDAFNVSMAQIGDMMGVSNATLNKLVRIKNFSKVHVTRGRRILSEEDISSWNEFLGEWPTGHYSDGSRNSVDSSEQHNDTPVESSDVISETTEYTTEYTTSFDESSKNPFVSSNVTKFNIGYDGDINLEEVVTYLKHMLGDNFTGHLEITFSK